MMIRKYLIGFFSLMLFVSGGAMAFLMIDESQDLSSRAGGWIGGNMAPLEVPKYDDGQREFFGSFQINGKRLGVSYSTSFWQEGDGGVLMSGDRKMTVRFLDGRVSSEEILSRYLIDGKRIKSLGKSGGEKSRESYIYSFYGKEGVVDVWSVLGGDVKVLVVMSDESGRDRVLGLFNKMELVEIKIKGAVSDVLDSEVRMVTLSRPSVVMVASNYCSKVVVDRKEGLLTSGGKSYPFCLATSGSGFFVDSRGYIATNGHVVKIDEAEALYYGIISGSLNDMVVDVMIDVFREVYGEEVSREKMKSELAKVYKSEEAMSRLLVIFEEFDELGLFLVDRGEYKYLIQLAKTPIKIAKDGKINLSEGVVEAKFVDANYGSYDKEKGFNGSDVALLKVEGDSVYPALPLGSVDDLDSGEGLQLIGFPGIASGNSVLLDNSANVEPTVTRGVVSAVKEAKGDKRKLVQTDASITHGNSGGPAIDSNGKVVGIATYGLSDGGGGNYNFLRDVFDLKELLAKNGIEVKTGETYDKWKLGLESYWLSYFKYSREDFETVKENYPAHVSVTRYLDDSKSKVGTNEDKTPKWTRSQRKLYMNIALGMMILSVLGMVAIFVWGIFDRKKKGFVGQFSQVSQVVPPVTTAPSSLPPPPSPPSGF